MSRAREGDTRGTRLETAANAFDVRNDGLKVFSALSSCDDRNDANVRESHGSAELVHQSLIMRLIAIW